MPHSTQPSASSANTFNLEVDDDRPPTVAEVEAEDDRPMTSKSNSSSAYGVAVTSQTPPRDERTELPSQRNSLTSARRKSAPSAHTYAQVMEAGGLVQEGIIIRKGESRDKRSSMSHEQSKRRSQYYEDQLSYKDGAVTSTRENVQKSSPVIAELKTNVIIKDEFTLVTDLSHHLAQRYNRPDTCIMIKVDHSACLALGGNFEPCYILNVQAVPSQMAPTTNKRNAALIQSFMADILSVPSERGIVTFVPIPEQDLAQNGNTVYGEMEKAEKNDVKRVAAETRKSMTFNNKRASSATLLNGDAKSNGNLVAESESSKSVTPEPSVVGGANGTMTARDRTNSSSSKTERPSTSHGAFNGLRMNPVSAESLVNNDTSRTPNGRPKTIGAPEPASIQEQIKAQSRAAKVEPKSTSITKAGPKYSTTPAASAPQPPRLVQNVPKPASTASTNSTVTAPVVAPGPTKPKSTPLISKDSKEEARQKNTYLDNVSTLTTKDAANSNGPASPTIIVTSSDDIPLKANQAKRRSTITATPKMPPAIPSSPPPERSETKSMSSRLSKRKSFLRMFKRNSVPAWYEQ